MEEDDLLGLESKELDLRAKIQRNFSNRHGAYSERSGFCEENPRFRGHGGRPNENVQRRADTRGISALGIELIWVMETYVMEGSVFQQARDFNRSSRGDGGKAGHGAAPRRFEGDIR